MQLPWKRQPELSESELHMKVQADRKRNIVSGIIVMFLIAAVIAWQLFSGNGTVKPLQLEPRTDMLVIHDPLGGTMTIPWTDVTGIRMEESWEPGVCLEDGNLPNCLTGLWRSSRIGDYYLFAADRQTSPVLVLETKGMTFVLSAGSREATLQLRNAAEEYTGIR